MINIAVCGANGKMGQEVIKAVNEAEDLALVAKIDIKDGEFATIKDAAASVKIDILIDFTQPKSICSSLKPVVPITIFILLFKQ